MKDTMSILRRAVFDTLNGNLSYLGSPVNVYDEKKKATASDRLFVILGTQQESDDDTSEYFITDSTIDIEIYHKTEFEVSKDAIDEVSNQVMSLILPSPSLNGLPVQNLFLIQCVRRLRAISRNFSITDNESVLSKIITFTCKIVQQNL